MESHFLDPGWRRLYLSEAKREDVDIEESLKRRRRRDRDGNRERKSKPTCDNILRPPSQGQMENSTPVIDLMPTS